MGQYKRPFTPVMRRFLQDVFKPSHSLLGKRSRDGDDEHISSSAPLQTGTSANCLALQNEDIEEDAIIITALNVVPFCCHADLLTMSRSQLLAVAQTLNDKLPAALQIDLSNTDAFIRNAIEVLVGISRDVPPAPKAKRSLSMSMSSSEDFGDTFSENLPYSSPTRTANSRKRAHNADSNGTSRLASLREEDEGGLLSDRPQKRRRTIASSPIPTPVQQQRMVARSQSHRVAALRPKASPAYFTSSRILRSQSQRLPDLQSKRAYKNVTVARGRGRARSQSSILTSTPKMQQKVARSSEVPLDFREDLNINSPATVCASTSSGLIPRLSGSLDYSADQSCNDAREVIYAINDMSMSRVSLASYSDMDIGM